MLLFRLCVSSQQISFPSFLLESLAVNAPILEGSKGSLKVSAILPQQEKQVALKIASVGSAFRFPASFRSPILTLLLETPETETLPYFALRISPDKPNALYIRF